MSALTALGLDLWIKVKIMNDSKSFEKFGEITLAKDFFEKIPSKEVLHLVLIGTKPEIIKQAPLIMQLRKESMQTIIVHSGQHYDWNLSGGLEEEFNIAPDVNLNVRGELFEQQSQIIGRLGFVLKKIKEKNPRIIPYIYADTTTAVAGGIASFANTLGTAHVEAGLRTMTPPKKFFLNLLHPFDVEAYYDALKSSNGWKKGSYEPYPEQFDTRAAAPSAGVHFAPTHLNEKHLLDEGYDESRVFTVGNPVSDALEFAEKHVKQSKIFEKFPALETDSLIRFCIHRRENVSSFQRFSSIFNAMKKLVEEEKTVLLISLNATEKAIDSFGFRKEIEKLSRFKNFVYSPVWPYYTDVIAAMKKCRVVATDSGSIQEETNILGIPGVVLRFNSDRPEAIFAGSNLLSPPIREDIVYKIIKEAEENNALRKKMLRAKSLYGKDVSKKIIKHVNSIVKNQNLFELFEHEKLGLNKLAFWNDGISNKW